MGRVFDLQIFADDSESESTSTSQESTEEGTGNEIGEGSENNENSDNNNSDSNKDDKEIIGENKEETEEKVGAPEKYENFNIPENFSYDEETGGKFNELAKKYNLSQEAAQEFVDFATNMMSDQKEKYSEASAKYLEELDTKWVDGVKTDWGNKFDENVASVRKVVGNLSGKIEGLEDLLNGHDETLPGVRLADNPAMANLFLYLSKVMGEDTLETGKHVSREDNLAKKFYPNQN